MAFTYDYSQPEEYHFSLDSVEAPLKISKLIGSESVSDWRVLDLCAGCGVLGLELNYHLPLIRRLDFVEVQEIYKTHFEENLRRINRVDLQTQFILKNYSQLRLAEFHQKYDLVLCNPPYFRVDQGKLSPSEFKNRCRFFIDSNFEELIKTILWVLKPRAKAYLLLRDLSEHKKSVLKDLQIILGLEASMKLVGEIRGTHLVEVKLTPVPKSSEA